MTPALLKQYYKILIEETEKMIKYNMQDMAFNLALSAAAGQSACVPAEALQRIENLEARVISLRKKSVASRKPTKRKTK